MNTRTDCVFRFRSKNSVDVFLGEGWDSHFHFIRQGHLWKVEHAYLDSETFKSITNSLNRITQRRSH